HPHLLLSSHLLPRDPHSFPTRRSSDLSRPDPPGRSPLPLSSRGARSRASSDPRPDGVRPEGRSARTTDRLRVSSAHRGAPRHLRSEEHTSELQSRFDLVCRLLLEKKKI